MKQMVALGFLTALISLAPQGGFALFSARPVAAAAFDEFGIQQLYPSITEGLAWDSEHWSNGNPRTLTSANWDADDPSGWSRHAGSQCITIDGNGEMIFNKDCGGSIHPRLYLDTVTNDGKKFKNVEITGYHMRVKDADLSYGGFVFGARSGPSGHGSTGDHCLATTYYGQLKNNGVVAFTKELVHSTARGKGIQTLFPNGMPYDVWIGLKFVVYNINNDSEVKLELYIDQTNGLNGGDWQLIGEFVDDGNWSGGVDEELAGCMERGLFPDGEFHVITEGNGVVFIRDTDVDEGRYKLLTVREIAAASENQAPTANAGPDQTVSDADENGVEPVTLNGSASSDPDGIITSYLWKEADSTVLGNTASITANLTVGTHTLTLTVTDDGGATDSDTVVIAVQEPEVKDWFSGDLEPGVWSESGNRKGRNARKDYRYQPPSTLDSIQQVMVTINVAGLDRSGSLNSDGASPHLEVWILNKKKLLHRIGTTRELSAVQSLTFESTGGDVVNAISAGKANQIRVIVGSLNQDRASGTDDLVVIDLVEVRITPKP